MKALIVAAGYATRLYPLTQNFPKPLLEVGGKSTLDHLLDQIKTIPEIDCVFIIPNSRFVSHFEKWRADFERQNAASPFAIEILDDGTTTNENRLGAVGDIQFAI